MEGFFATAWRYLKGESGLPSLLPHRATIEKAKKDCRKVRLFCEGLEKFREILYVETVLEEGLSHMTDTVQGEGFPGKEEAIADEKTREYVFSAGEDPFQSADARDESTPPSPDSESSTSQLLDERDKHPPSSPDSEASASTSLDSSDNSTPSSPSSGSSASTLTDTMEAEVESSPIITRDFAYSSLDWRHLGPSVLFDDEDGTPRKPDLKAESEEEIQDASQNIEAEVSPEEEEVVDVVDVSQDVTSACAAMQQVPKSSTDDHAEVHEVNATVGRGAEVAAPDEQCGALATSKASVLDDDLEKIQDSEFQSEEANQPEVQNEAIENYLPTLDGQKVGLINDQCSSELSGGDPVSEANHNDLQPPAEQSDSERGGDEAPANNKVQGTCGGCYWQGHETFEFPEAAGPATLWGILQNSQYEHEAENQGEDHAAQMTGVSEAAGPATLWGILQSEHFESVGEKREEAEETTADIPTTLDRTPVSNNDDYDEEEGEVPHKHETEKKGENHAAQMTSVSDAPGPAALWGILCSEHRESVGKEREEDKETAADIPAALDQANVSDDDDDNEEEEEGEVPQAPTNTPAIVSIDKDDETKDASSEATSAQESAAGTGEASPNDVPGPVAVQTEKEAEASTVLSGANDDSDPSKSGESGTFARADGPHVAIPDNIQSVKVTDGENVSAPAVKTVVDEISHQTDQSTNDVALKSSSVTSAQEGDSEASENTNALQTPTDIVSSSPPHTPSSSQVEQSDVIPPTIQPRKPAKAQQRAIARRRGAQTKMEATELKRRVKEKGADTPEVRAQAQAEADAKIGERKLKLQAARELSWYGRGAHARR